MLPRSPAINHLTTPAGVDCKNPATLDRQTCEAHLRKASMQLVNLKVLENLKEIKTIPQAI